MGEGNHGMVDPVGDFSGDLFGVVVFKRHHDFGSFFAEFFEDFVISGGEELGGVGAFGGTVAAIADNFKDLGEGIGGRGLDLAVNLVETASFSRVAGNIADLLDPDEQAVAIAVVAKRSHFLQVTGGGAFMPEFLARPTPVPAFSGFEGFLQGVSVHPGHHQNGTVEVVLGDRRDESLVVITNAIEGNRLLHGS